MNTNDDIQYLVGREIDNEFWCELETHSLDKAQEFLLKKLEDQAGRSWWCIYEKRSIYRLVETAAVNQSKEEQLTKAMVAAM